MALMTTEASRIYLIARDGRRLWIWTGFLLLAIVALVGSLFLPGSTPFVFAWLRVAIMWVLVIGTIFVATQLAGALWGRGWLGFLLMVVPPFIGLVTGPVALEVATWRRLRSLGVRCGVFGVGAKVHGGIFDRVPDPGGARLPDGDGVQRAVQLGMHPDRVPRRAGAR
jgi:hypothetical protein